MKVKSLALCLFLTLASSGFADNLSPYLDGRLNFFVDEKLIVTSSSANAMGFAVKKEDIYGRHIMDRLPLSAHDKNKIEKYFAKARETGTSQTVHYWLNLEHQKARYFEAELTPMNHASGPAGFFIKVREIRLFDQSNE